jgi:hypothetical protein
VASHGIGAKRIAANFQDGWILIAAGVSGIALRVWVMLSPMGRIDSDGAVKGLMAIAWLKHSDPVLGPAFLWGQAYGGTQGVALTAASFAIFGVSPAALQITEVVEAALALAALYVLGRTLLDRRAATLATAVALVWPAAYIWWSTAPSGSYWPSLAFSFLALSLLARVTRSPSSDGNAPLRSLRRPVVMIGGAGLLAGQALWANPQSLYVLLPGLAWFLPDLLRHLRYVVVGVVSATIGGAPWIWANLRSDFASLHYPSYPSTHNSYFDHLVAFFHFLLPQALGLQQAQSRAWLGDGVGAMVEVALIVGIGISGWVEFKNRRRTGFGLVISMILIFPFLFAFSREGYFTERPRYVIFLWPFLCLWVGRQLSLLSARRRPMLDYLVQVVVLTAFASTSLVMLGQFNQQRLFEHAAPDRLAPPDSASLVELMDSHKVAFAFSNYWLAYQATFYSDERLRVSPFAEIRDQALARQVRHSADPGYAFLSTSRSLSACERDLRGLSIPFTIYRQAQFTLLVPKSKVLPTMLPGSRDW